MQNNDEDYVNFDEDPVNPQQGTNVKYISETNSLFFSD